MYSAGAGPSMSLYVVKPMNTCVPMSVRNTAAYAYARKLVVLPVESYDAQHITLFNQLICIQALCYAHSWKHPEGSCSTMFWKLP